MEHRVFVAVEAQREAEAVCEQCFENALEPEEIDGFVGRAGRVGEVGDGAFSSGGDEAEFHRLDGERGVGFERGFGAEGVVGVVVGGAVAEDASKLVEAHVGFAAVGVVDEVCEQAGQHRGAQHGVVLREGVGDADGGVEVEGATGGEVGFAHEGEVDGFEESGGGEVGADGLLKRDDAGMSARGGVGV